MLINIQGGVSLIFNYRSANYDERFFKSTFQGGQSRDLPDWVLGLPTSQVRKIVHNFRYTKSFMGLSANKTSYFSAQGCVKVFPGFAAVYQIN